MCVKCKSYITLSSIALSPRNAIQTISLIVILFPQQENVTLHILLTLLYVVS